MRRRIAVVLMIGAIAGLVPLHRVRADLGDEVEAPIPAEQSFESFLDSLQTRDATVSRQGVREEWPAADSLAALVIERGPAVADSLSQFPPPKRFQFDGGPSLITYNRVEGFRLGARLELKGDRFSLTGAAGYAFSAERWRHREEWRFNTESAGSFFAHYRDLVEPYGLRLPEAANSVYAFFAGADDMDYLRREGFGFGWRVGAQRRSLEAEFAVHDESSEPARTDWNLFSRDRGPRPNPAIDEGTARRIMITARSAHEVPSLRGAAIDLDLGVEIAGYGLGGDFDYDRYQLEIETDFHALARDDARLRLLAGGARNGLPVQSRFYLGGPAALRAYGVNEFSGDRLLHASLDYLVGTDPMARLGLRRIQIQFVPFAEIGAAWFDDDGRGLFSEPRSSDWRSDAGIGFQRNVFFGATLRFDLAYRLDRGSDRLTTRFAFKAPLFDRLAGEEMEGGRRREERRERRRGSGDD